MFKFFHKLFNPHCPQCLVDKQISEINPVVENLKLELARTYEQLENLQESNPIVDVLRNELERSFRNNDKLLEQLFDKLKYEKDLLERTVVNPSPPNHSNMVPISPNRRSWATVKKTLEENSKLEAQEMARLRKENIVPVTQVTEDELESEIDSVKNHA